MTNTFIDDQTTLNTGMHALHEMAAALTGTTLLARSLNSATLGGIKADGTQRILVASGSSIQAHLAGIHLLGSASGVYNDGTISSVAGAAILLTGGGLSSVTNLGTVTTAAVAAVAVAASTSASDKLNLFNSGTLTATAGALAIQGGYGNDRIVNTGTIGTTAGATVIDLKDGNDFYEGAQGTATGIIRLGAGNDTAYGGLASEVFSGGTGSNYMDGGSGGGTDTVDYSDATGGITVNLGTDSTQRIYADVYDVILNMENVIGSIHNDSLTGDFYKNHLKGGNGDDTLEGGLGDDTLEGGAGSNTAKYTGSAAANVNLSLTGEQDTTGYGKDTLIDIDNLEGGSGADIFTGNDDNNRLIGNNGNDALRGGGSDTLQGGSGDDTLAGGAGNDTLEGGAGRNTAEFSGARGNYTIVNNADGTVTVTDNTGQDGTDQLKEVRFAKFADQTIALTNGAASNISPSISPINFSESKAVGSQVTTLFSSDPDGDTLTFSLVTDAGGLFTLDGNKLILAGALDYETATKHTITVKVSDGFGGDFAKDLTINVTNSTTETNSLVKRGTNASEQVVGENGNDKLYGLNGNDEIFGQGGDDTLWGGKGKDTFIGGAGKDVFVLDQKPSKSNLDWIYDFDPKEDTIHLARKAFSKIGRKGGLKKDAFIVGDRVKDKEDRIIYHKKAGALFYDPDGTGSAKAVQFATIGKKLAIKHSDFDIF
ncbi:hypothetical protein [Microvirga lenta]|uniref:hypothetical protein n=1 Tax=Microvirga lenta TaxID=2881337 RepID=UPI001CFC74D3|nr:hypothetical protein [Microvirga lenta]MCB5174705.1 hypothetical protein [Microvirga lenta]